MRFLCELQPLNVNKGSSGTASLAAMKPEQDRAKRWARLNFQILTPDASSLQNAQCYAAANMEDMFGQVESSFQTF